MKVILLKDIENLGQAGQTREVSLGYARNFLFPKNLAQPATEQNIIKIREEENKKAKMAEQDLLKTEKIADELSKTAVEIKQKINQEGQFYAAVSEAMIVKKLKEKGFALNKKQIILPLPIKEPGEYKAQIKLPHNLEAEVTVIVAAE